ncbi:NAD(P)H-hydrate epimerase [Frigoribacterium sp. CFBP 13712]|uniref:NAD(P)H-hydrate epimerase n=1 Tax=Frigoribacterium sp. CFBP 13712 TaxID=2775309 RepID=UPI001780EE96|nr:NAD(P)H-hydrate epimerase [Frigoribacterium sp. CFBP 13712]MBD8702729.1 NAD(P)H-hydrate epimerase [Frigoribacterium sp. CFBP 13712]
MTDAWTAAQIRAAEKPLLEAGEPLMQRAADGLAGVVSGLLRASSAPRILLLVGSGDNGGDALYAGASLAQEFVPGGVVTVVPTGSRLHEAGLDAALVAGATVDALGPWTDPAAAPGLLREYDVVLDGMVGTGASGGLRGDARRVVAALGGGAGSGGEGAGAGSAGPGAGGPVPSGPVLGRPLVVAVDLPSGLHPDDGSAELVLPADVTVTFGGRKAGLLRGSGPMLAGRVVLIDIGLRLGAPELSTP